ncbi:MAG: helix-turn-helix domain-containing protein [Erysipelotrichaceae bacterium]
MEELGRILQEARESKGISREEASEQTRLTVRYITAIEEGNMDAFKDDLTYLRFFLKAYCEFLEVDFDEMKDKVSHFVDEYTHTMSVTPMTRYEDLPNKPKKANRKRKEYNYKAKVRRFDFSFASLLSVIVMIVLLLIFSFTVFVLPRMNATPTPQDPTTPPVVETPSEEPEEPEVPAYVTVITKVDATTYEVSGLNMEEEMLLKLNFGSNAWFEARVNGIVLAEPKSQVYAVNDT